MVLNFPHRHAGHCETGTLAALLRHRGVDLSEPMVFGIGSGLFFIHIPFVKVGGIPLTAYRGPPRQIINKVCKRLGIKLHQERYRSETQGMRALDRFLESGIPVGLQTSVYWLPYFPADLRFQFNAHNLVAFGKQDGDYWISDPVAEHVVSCPADDLQRARFAKGVFAPKGLAYYPARMPERLDLKAAALAGLRDTVRQMLDIPLPFMGVRGIATLAKRIERWPAKLGPEKARSYLSSVVRMQEEIGTGGAGFRFMYAAFLQEAAKLLNRGGLDVASERLSATGDRWREFAVLGARVCKGKETDPKAYAELAHVLRDCSQREREVFSLIRESF